MSLLLKLTVEAIADCERNCSDLIEADRSDLVVVRRDLNWDNIVRR